MVNSKELILCTGGAGSIGSELVRQLAENNLVYFIDNNETGFFNLHEELNQKGFDVKGHVGDIRDKNVFNRMVRLCGLPSKIFHTAALKHVTPSAWSREEYVSTNIGGTFNVLDFAEKHRIKVINISTDKVVNANSIMATTKKVAEVAVKDANQISVRFGNVLGSRGSVIEIWQKQINAGEPLTVTDENMTRYMMSISEACELVITASEIGEPGSIMVMDMGEKVNVLKLAQDILGKSGKDLGVKMIGMRQGETLTEKLMTEEEEKTCRKVGNFWLIK